MFINEIGWPGWLAMMLLIVAALLMVVHVSRWIINKRVSLNRSRQLKALATSMVFLWAAGLLAYMYALASGSGTFHSFELLFRSALCSLGMFAFQVDGDVFANITGDNDAPLIRGIISVITILASLLTVLLFVSLVAHRLWAYLRLVFSTIRATIFPRRRLFVFFGINDASKVLAEDIRKTQKENDYSIIFVETPLTEDEGEQGSGIDSIMSILTHRAETFRTAVYNNALLSIASSRLSDLSTSDIEADNNVLCSIGVGLLARIVRNMHKTKNAEAHYFILSDSDTDNLNKAGVLRLDSTIMSAAERGVKTTLYCHARYNSAHRVIEDEACGENIDVRIIDSSRICVEHLKQDVSLQPVNFVDVEQDGTVSSPFNALVIGFGEVGLDAVRFLYEFSAFAATGSTSEKVERSPYHCDVVDNRMDILAGKFYTNTPALRSLPVAPRGELSQENADNSIVLHNFDARSAEFSKLLLDKIKTLNYVVVATADDTLNITLAVRIMRLAIRYSQRPQMLRILVRVHDRSDGNIDIVADHYNRLFKAQNDKETLRAERPDGPITLFGDFASIHTYENIVSDRLVREARRYLDKYNNRFPSEWKEDWDARHRRLLGNGKGSHFSPSMSNIMELRRKESQDIANAKHAATKLLLAQKAFEKSGKDGKAKLQELRSAITNGTITREFGKTSYTFNTPNSSSNAQPSTLDSQRPILATLAWTEHLRWCASHEVLGYVYGDKKDEARMTHDNLVPWQELTEEVQSYDCNVVDVSLEEIE